MRRRKKKVDDSIKKKKSYKNQSLTHATKINLNLGYSIQYMSASEGLTFSLEGVCVYTCPACVRQKIRFYCNKRKDLSTDTQPFYKIYIRPGQIQNAFFKIRLGGTL